MSTKVIRHPKSTSFSIYNFIWISLLLLAFIIQPFLGMLVVIATNTYLGRFKSKDFLLIALVCSCYLGLLNLTKLPDSDYISYLEMYSTSRAIPLGEFLLLFSREPVYYIYLHSIANLPFSSAQLFVFLSTALTYLISLVALIRTCKIVGLPGSFVTSFILCFVFFAPLFSLSAHVMRQFFSASLVLLFFSELLLLGVRRWWLLAIAVLMHYSALFFALVAIIKKSKVIPSHFLALMYLGLLPMIYIFARSAADTFSNIPLLGYVFKMAGRDEGHPLEHLSLVAVVFVIIAIVISIANLKFKYNDRLKLISERGWGLHVGTIMLGIVVLISNSITGGTEIAGRFFFYEYFLIALILPLFVAAHPYSKPFFALAPLLLIPYFFFNMQHGTWDYAPFFDLITSPSWVLWSYRRL